MDDEKKFLDTLSTRIRLKGFEPLPAASGREALEIARRHEIYAVVVDLKMPDMDGIEAGRLIEQHYDIPVLYITGYYHRAEALQKKGKSPLLKPFGPDDLRNAVACFDAF